MVVEQVELQLLLYSNNSETEEVQMISSRQVNLAGELLVRL